MCSSEIVLLCCLIKARLIVGVIFIKLIENNGWGKEEGKRNLEQNKHWATAVTKLESERNWAVFAVNGLWVFSTFLFSEPDFSYLDALAPYQPLAMKCVYCPIDTRLNFIQVSKLLKEVQVRNFLLPFLAFLHTAEINKWIVSKCCIKQKWRQHPDPFFNEEDTELCFRRGLRKRGFL